MRLQTCDTCFHRRHGGGGRQPFRLRSDVRELTPCAICGEPTDSGWYPDLDDRDVRTEVLIVFEDGPAAGVIGRTARMNARTYDALNDLGVPTRYDLHLIGGVLYGKVSAVQREDELRTPGIIVS